MLTKETIIRELIKYDSEHPETLGEMADRREVYALRLEAMSVDADVVVRKIQHFLGDDINTDYTIPNPFASLGILVHAYMTADGQEILNPPDITRENITYRFSRPIKAGEVMVMIAG